MTTTYTNTKHGADQPGCNLCLWEMRMDKIEEEQCLPPDTSPQLTSVDGRKGAVWEGSERITQGVHWVKLEV